MSRCSVWLLVFASGLCTGAPVHADGRATVAPLAVAEVLEMNAEQLTARVQLLLQSKPSDAVAAPLELAKRSLERAKAAQDAAARERALSLARAALSLAEARNELAREAALIAQSERDRAQRVTRMEDSKRLAEQARARLAAPARANAEEKP